MKISLPVREGPVDRRDDGEGGPCVLSGEYGIAIVTNGVDHVLKLNAMTRLWVRPGIVDVGERRGWTDFFLRIVLDVPEKNLVVLPRSPRRSRSRRGSRAAI